MTLKKMLDQKEKQAPAIDEDTISVLIDRINQVTQNSKALQVVDLIKKIDDKVKAKEKAAKERAKERKGKK